MISTWTFCLSSARVLPHLSLHLQRFPSIVKPSSFGNNSPAYQAEDSLEDEEGGEEVNEGRPTLWQLPDFPFLIRDLRLDLVISRLGTFKFKGSPDPISMVNVSIASLMGRM